MSEWDSLSEPRLPMWLPPARCDHVPPRPGRVVDDTNGMVFERRCTFPEHHRGAHHYGWVDIVDYVRTVDPAPYL